MKRVIKADTSTNSTDVFVWDGKSEVPEDVVNVRIEDGVTEIGEYAFYKRYKLRDVTIPESVTHIRHFGFANCYGLRNVKIPDSVTLIGGGAFRFCGLRSIIIPGSVTVIDDGAFAHCDNLSKVTMLDGVISIGDAAFLECRLLKEVTVPDSVTSIGERAFYKCDYLSDIEIPNSVTSIGSEAFKNCYSLDPNIRNKIRRIRRKSAKDPKNSNKNSTFVNMRDDLSQGIIENLCYDSQYSEYINEIYHKSVSSLESKYINLYVEPSIQAGVGSVFASYGEDGATYKTHWDYEDECEAIEEMVVNCSNENELVEAISDYIDTQLENAELSEDGHDADDIATL